MTGRVGVAILAATGAVGQRFIQLLDGHPTLEVRCVVASQRSAGKRYAEATKWMLDTTMPPAVASLVVEDLDSLLARDDVQVAFSALPGGLAGPVETRLAEAGLAVFTNAKDHRMTPNVPLLIPEVNPDHLALLDRQDTPGFVVANGNCSGIILTLALAPLHRTFGIDELHVTTLQGLSGAGYPGVSALDVVDNIVPYIGGEEDKLETEPQRTLGAIGPDGLVAPAAFDVYPTATRVPVREGHLESVHVRLGRAVSLEEVRAAFESFRGPDDLVALPSAPHQPIHVLDAPDRPQPRRDRDLDGGMAVSVGRLRLSADGRTLQFLVLGHNTVRGAAGQSILNAEFVQERGLLERVRAAAKTA